MSCALPEAIQFSERKFFTLEYFELSLHALKTWLIIPSCLRVRSLLRRDIWSLKQDVFFFLNLSSPPQLLVHLSVLWLSANMHRMRHFHFRKHAVLSCIALVPAGNGCCGQPFLLKHWSEFVTHKRSFKQPRFYWPCGILMIYCQKKIKTSSSACIQLRVNVSWPALY